MMRVLVLALALALCGCCNLGKMGSTPPRVEVQCFETGGTISCLVKHVSGSVGARACWDVHFFCTNGTKVTGRACENVVKGGTTSHVFHANDLANLNRCDHITTSKVDDLVVTATY